MTADLTRTGSQRSTSEEEIVNDGFWRKLRRNLARLPFAESLLAAYYCALDPATPNHVRAVLIGALAYFVLPTDLVPDFIPALGFTDDASVLFAAFSVVSRYVTPAHRRQARARLNILRRG